MTVQKILKVKGDSRVVTVASTASLSEAVQVLSARRIGAVVVSDDGAHPLGILSERDIVRELGKRGGSCMSDPVTRVMTSKLVTWLQVATAKWNASSACTAD